MAAPFLARFPRHDGLTLTPSPKECTGRRTLTSKPKFLGWIVNQMFVAMGLRFARDEPRNYRLVILMRL